MGPLGTPSFPINPIKGNAPASALSAAGAATLAPSSTRQGSVGAHYKLKPQPIVDIDPLHPPPPTSVQPLPTQHTQSNE